MENLKDKIVLITGNGFLAKYLTKELLECSKEIRIFSRNEKEQWKTKMYFNNPKVKLIIGDIRDYDALYSALKGVDYCIHTGAIKRIDVAEKQPMEAIKTNIIGSMNVINACVNRKVKKLILISTDKATSATTCYGSTKFLMECMINSNNTDTEMMCCRYGNVWNSTGSIVPIFRELAKEGKPLTVRNPEMTRFFQTVDKSVELILDMIKYGKDKELWCFQAKSATIQQIADIISENQIVVGTENEEKNDEALLTIAELNSSKRFKDYYIIHKDYKSDIKYSKPLTSDNAERYTIEELKQMYKDCEE